MEVEKTKCQFCGATGEVWIEEFLVACPRCEGKKVISEVTREVVSEFFDEEA